jgi:hypothetical protein
MDWLQGFFILFEQKGVLSIAFFTWAFVVWFFSARILRRLDMVLKSMHILSARILTIENHLEGLNEGAGFKPYRNGDYI